MGILFIQCVCIYILYAGAGAEIEGRADTVPEREREEAGKGKIRTIKKIGAAEQVKERFFIAVTLIEAP